MAHSMKIFNIIEGPYPELEEKYKDIDLNVLIDINVLDDKHDNSIAWLVEPPDILECYFSQLTTRISFYDFMTSKLKSGDHKFKCLYTFDRRYSSLPNTEIVPCCFPSWIAPEDSALYEKTKLLTFITSLKNVTPLQNLRVNIAEQLLRMNIRVYGNGINPIENKVDILKDYYFCFAIENGIHSGYHTEKVLDCFRTGTVPVYIGDPDIGEVFNTDGMIILNDKFKLDEIISKLTIEQYEKMIPAIEENYRISLSYNPTMDKVLDSIIELNNGR